MNACLRRACKAGRKHWQLEREIVLVAEMGVYIFALVDDADDFNATECTEFFLCALCGSARSLLFNPVSRQDAKIAK